MFLFLSKVTSFPSLFKLTAGTEISSKPFNSYPPNKFKRVQLLCVMSMTFSKVLCLPSCLLWKNQYGSSIFCPGNLWSVPLSLLAQLGNIMHQILNLRGLSVLRKCDEKDSRSSCKSLNMFIWVSRGWDLGQGGEWFMMRSTDVSALKCQPVSFRSKLSDDQEE